MSINKYIAFLKIVESGSITGAAAALGHTQSGVTQLIRSLESEVGFCLFHRTRQGILLTEEGEKLYPLIQDVVDADRRLLEAISGLRKMEKKTLRIGTFTSVAVNWLPEILKEYQLIAPDIHFELVDCGYNNIEEALTKQQMDFGFVPLPLNLSCECIPLYKDRLLAALPQKHKLASSKSCPIDIFTTEPVISLIPGIDRDARKVFEKHQITPNIKYTVENDYAMLAMVEKDLGICIVPELILQGSNHPIVTMELDPPAYRNIGIAFPPNHTVKEDARQFAQFAADWVQKNK